MTPAPSLATKPGFREFVAIIAAMMAINALGIDVMLPALPVIGRALDVANENSRQFIVAAYVLGFGSAQIVYGPLSDRYGRKPILIGCLTGFTLLSIVVSLSTSFEMMIAARFLQGIAAAASRVLVVSIVRDRYAGRQMARVMSLSFVVFLAVPILAPTIGQGILLVADWRAIFYFLAAFGGGIAIWAGLRLPETLRPELRLPISPAALAASARTVLGDRDSRGYTLASTLLFGGLMGFINSVQQIFADSFHRPGIFTLVFAGIAGTMAFASVLNANIVERVGTHRVSHFALIGFIAFGALHSLVAFAGLETVWTFALLQAGTMFCFALAASNFGAMAMQPVGHIAGIASSIQGFTGTVGGALIGLAIGQSFDGTTRPIAVGYLLVGLGALGVVLATERGRLFRPRLPMPARTRTAEASGT